MFSSNTAIFTVSNGTMSLNAVYAFTVVVLSKDHRSDSRTVIVRPSIGTAQLLITSSFTRFNPSAKLVLESINSADYAANFTWSVLTALGAPVNIVSLTTKSIAAFDDFLPISFSLSVIGKSFDPGMAYIFQLTAPSTVNAAHTIFSQIILTANSAPTSGRIVSSPKNGSALVTQFALASPGWIADAGSFPLSYAFSYTVFGASAHLTIAAPSVRPYTITMLPAGVIILQTQVTDIYLTLATEKTIVNVTSAPALSKVSHILNTSLTIAFAVGDINLAIQTVNNVSILHFS